MIQEIHRIGQDKFSAAGESLLWDVFMFLGNFKNQFFEILYNVFWS